MAKSIMQMDWDTCYLCGRNRIADPCGLEEHHVFGGAKRLIWQSRQQGRRYLNLNVGPMMIS